MSLVGAACTALFDRWVFSTAGMASFIAWNVLVIACFGLIALGGIPFGRAPERAPSPHPD
jgi:hypothetical protein